MNVTKMRHQVERTEVAEVAAIHRRWYRSLTPQHRAVHDQGRMCGECISKAFANMGKIAKRASA